MLLSKRNIGKNTPSSSVWNGKDPWRASPRGPIETELIRGALKFIQAFLFFLSTPGHLRGRHSKSSYDSHVIWPQFNSEYHNTPGLAWTNGKVSLHCYFLISKFFKNEFLEFLLFLLLFCNTKIIYWTETKLGPNNWGLNQIAEKVNHCLPIDYD